MRGHAECRVMCCEFGGLLSRRGTSVQCHVARDKKRVRCKKQFLKAMLGEDVFVVADCYVVIFQELLGVGTMRM